MQKLITTFVKYPILGNVIIFVTFIFGYMGLKSLDITFFPHLPSKFIIIQAIYPGASPEEVEEGIVLKIEDNLRGITGIDRVSSVSNENSGTITVELHTGYDINVALQDVKNAVDEINSFPVGMEKIVVYKREEMNFAISFAVTGDVNLKTLKIYARKIERDLRSVDGISKIKLSGFPDEEIQIAFREEDLQTYKLTFAQAAAAVRNSNLRITGGKLRGEKEELLIRANAKGYYATDLENLVIKTTSDGTIIRLKDVADVKDRWSETPNRVYYNNKPAVQIDINTTNEEDIFFISNYTKDYLKKFNAGSTTVKAYVLRDGSDIIQERINILEKNGFTGMILVIIFLSLFLNYRLALWVALGIPVAFSGMFFLGPIYGITVNVMSLLGMILVVGILVDDGIVVSENIYQHYEKGKKPLQAAIDGTKEVLPSVISSVLTTVVIFMTFFFLEGGMGDRTKDMAFVVIAALVFSLIEATFILPAHIAHSKALHIKQKDKNRLEKAVDNGLQKFREKIYKPALQFAIDHGIITLAIILALFMVTMGAIKGGIVRTTFFPNIEMDNTTVKLELPAGTRENVTDSILQIISQKAIEVNEEHKKQYPEDGDVIIAFTRYIGPATHQGGLNITYSKSGTRNISSLEITDQIRRKVGHIPGTRKLAFGGNVHFGMPISVAIIGENLKDTRRVKEIFKNELRKIKVLKDVSDDDPPGLREINITLKEKAYVLGLNTGEVLSQVRAGFFGYEAQRVQRGIDEVKIWVRYKEKERMNIKQLENMRIRTGNNKSYPLKEIADLSIGRGISTIHHLESQRVITVVADIANPKVSVTDIIAFIKSDIIPKIKKTYPSVKFDFEGQSRETAKTMRTMKSVIPAILIIMFVIIVVTFRSFFQAIIVFALIPFSFIGVVWGHFLQGHILSILSMFGIIALAGIVVNDSLVMISTMNQNLKKGLGFKESLLQAGLSRLRPVLLTSLTTIAGLGPLIFESSFQAQFLSPMAISVAYGLIIGTLLTLLLLPAFLSLINSMKVKLYSLFTGKQYTSEDVEPALREDIFVKEQQS